MKIESVTNTQFSLFFLPSPLPQFSHVYTTKTPRCKKVLDDRVFHIAYVPSTPEPYYQSSGQEIQPRPVGEENGTVVYMYNPISAVNYVSAFVCFLLVHFGCLCVCDEKNH